MNLLILLIGNGDRNLAIGRTDVQKHRRSANSDHSDGCSDFHTARFGNLTGDESSCTLKQALQRVVRGTVRVVDEIIQHEPRACGQIECRTIVQHQAQCRIAAGLDNVALIEGIARIGFDGDTVAHDARAAGHLDDVTNNLGARGRCSGLSICCVARQGLHEP